MLRNALPRPGDRLRRNHRGSAAPALVGVLIDIAMITGQVTPAVDLEDELPEGQAAPRGGQGSDGGIEGGYRRSRLTFSDADPAHYVRVFDFIEANFRVKREVMNVGHVRSEDVVRVRSSHMWIGSLGRYRRSSPSARSLPLRTTRGTTALRLCPEAYRQGSHHKQAFEVTVLLLVGGEYRDAARFIKRCISPGEAARGRAR